MDMLDAKINFFDLEDNRLAISSKTSVSYTNHTHPNSATSYRVETDGHSTVYTTDCEHPKNLNTNVVDIAKNADILIHDSHFSAEDLINFKGWGHSSWQQAVEVAKLAHVKHLVLFHYNPDYNDEDVLNIEKAAQQNFKHVTASKQGMKIIF
jgi:ribonuclease BN (tRNA processing enzyme)